MGRDSKIKEYRRKLHTSEVRKLYFWVKENCRYRTLERADAFHVKKLVKRLRINNKGGQLTSFLI